MGRWGSKVRQAMQQQVATRPDEAARTGRRVHWTRGKEIGGGGQNERLG
jgi:hypothetical protein